MSKTGKKGVVTRHHGVRVIRNRETAPKSNVPATAPGVKDVPAIQAPAGKAAALVRGGTTSGTPGQIVRFWNRWRENYNALTALTIARVRSLNEMTQRGDHAYPQWTYRTIERRHPVLKALIDCCEAPLENIKWDVRIKEQLPEGFTEADAEKQKAALKAAYGQIDNLREALKHLSHADFSGYAHCQKHYLDGEVVHLEPLFTFCVCRDGLFGDWFWNPDSRSMTAPEFVLSEKNRIGGDNLPRLDFIIREVERPINEIGLENFVRRKLIEKDWSAFDEIFGIPSGVVIMPPGIPKELVAEYEASAKQISEGGSGAMPHGSDYKKNDMPHDGSALFKTHISSLDEDLVLAGTGGKLKMLVEHAAGGAGGGGGNVRGSSKTQDDTFKEIAMARGNDVAQQFRRDFDNPFLTGKFPLQPVLVEFCLVTENEVDVSAICTNVNTLKQAGKNVKTDFIAAQTGYEFEADTVPPNPDANKLPLSEDELEPAPGDTLAMTQLKNRLRVHNRTLVPAAATAPEDLGATLHEMILPLIARLEKIAAIDDPGIQQHMIEKLLADYPQISAAITADDSLAKKLSPQLESALIAGLTTTKPATKEKVTA